MLDEGDFAIFDFNEGMGPESLTIVFIAAGVLEDRNIHVALNRYRGTRKMIAISPSELNEIIDTTSSIIEHPITRISVDVDKPDSDLENVALGGSPKPRVRGTRSGTFHENNFT